MQWTQTISLSWEVKALTSHLCHCIYYFCAFSPRSSPFWSHFQLFFCVSVGKLHWKAVILWVHLIKFTPTLRSLFPHGQPRLSDVCKIKCPICCLRPRQDIMISTLSQPGSILTQATVRFILIMICLDLCKVSFNSIVCKFIYFDALTFSSRRWNMNAGSIFCDERSFIKFVYHPGFVFFS